MFEEFVRHVLWSHNHGFQNSYWTSIYDLCKLCTRNYDHVVRIETAQEEVYGLFQLVHHPSNVTLHAINLPDFHMYLGLPEQLLDRIIELYWLDFHLFGYSEHFISN